MQHKFWFLRNIKRLDGQSLVEIIVAMAIFSLMAVSMISLLLGGLTLSTEGGRITEANLLAQEGIEAVQSIKARAWNEIVYDRTAVSVVASAWDFVGENTSEQIGNFSRTIDFFDVYRNVQEEIVLFDEIGAWLDPQTKKITVTVLWDTGRGATNSVTKTTIMTNWDSSDWVQDSWSGGSGQQVIGNLDSYDQDDTYIESSVSNKLSLKEVATSTFATQGFLISSAYDMGLNCAASLIFVDGEIPDACPACEILVQIQSAQDSGGSPGTWSSTWSGPNGEDGNESDYYTASSTGVLIHTDHNDDRWLRYKVVLLGETDNTPIVREIKINHKN